MKLTHLASTAGREELRKAFAALNPGEGVVYFRGNTVALRGGGQITIARHAYDLHAAGRALLVRKPTAPAGTRGRQFDFIAVKKK